MEKPSKDWILEKVCDLGSVNQDIGETVDRDEMSSEKCQGSMIELGDMPEWLLVEVLIRLPAKLVFRFKLVSKQWLSVSSDPDFIRTYISRASVSPQLPRWTFISNNMNLNNFPFWVSLVDMHPTDSKHPDFYELPCPSVEPRGGERYNVLGVSNGLVLYNSYVLKRLHLPEFHRYNICNPITGQWISLPPHAHHDFKMVSSGFLTRVQNGLLTSYRVVCLELPLRKSSIIRLKVFFSEIGEWKKINVCIDQAIELPWWRMPTALNGIVHWITREHGIIAYDPYHKPDFLRLIALPGDINPTCNDKIFNGIPSLCGVHQGKLRYFEVSGVHMDPYGFSSFGVWILNDYTSGDWCLQHRISSADILYDDILSDQKLYLVPISFHPFDSDIVCLGYKSTIVSYNIKTKKLEAHGGPLDVDKQPCWFRTILLVIPPWPIYIFPHPLLE